MAERRNSITHDPLRAMYQGYPEFYGQILSYDPIRAYARQLLIGARVDFGAEAREHSS